jgi:hypothetical protein
MDKYCTIVVQMQRKHRRSQDKVGRSQKRSFRKGVYVWFQLFFVDFRLFYFLTRILPECRTWSNWNRCRHPLNCRHSWKNISICQSCNQKATCKHIKDELPNVIELPNVLRNIYICIMENNNSQLFMNIFGFIQINTRPGILSLEVSISTSYDFAIDLIHNRSRERKTLFTVPHAGFQ